MTFNRVVIVFSVLSLSACTSSKQQAEISQTAAAPAANEAYRMLAVKKYQDHISYIFNSGKSAVVCAKQIESTRLNPFPRLDFFVYDIANQELLFEDSVQSGKVVWSGENKIKVTLVPEVMVGNEPEKDTRTGYEYDVRMRKRIAIEP